MKKIKSCIMLTVLCSSLGLQTSVALASEVDKKFEDSEVSVEDTSEPTTEKPVEDTSETTTGKPTEDTSESTTEKPVEDTSETTTGKPTEDTSESATEKPAEDTSQSTTEKPTEDTSQSTTEKPAEDTSETTTEKPTEETSQSTIEKKTEDSSQSVVSVEKNNESTNQDNNQINPIMSSVETDRVIRYHVNKTTQEFINQIGEKARKIGLKNDLYASVMIAQAILESGSGSSALSDIPNYNLFGIKGDFKGETVSFATSEDDGTGSLYTIRANFRKYPSYKESLEDYAKLMNEGISGNQDFYKNVHKTYSTTYKEATRFLTGKYATDTHYNEKLNGLIETYQLDSYDKEKIKAEPMMLNDQKVERFTIENPVNHQSSSFIVPLYKGYVVSSPFEQRVNPVTGVEEHHNGIDLAVDAGTPIYASNQGVVIQSGFESGAGNYVMVQHENGLITNYFHMSSIAVETSQEVQMGEVLGYVGSTGNSTGNHLHFGLSTGVWSGYLNPVDYVDF